MNDLSASIEHWRFSPGISTAVEILDNANLLYSLLDPFEVDEKSMQIYYNNIRRIRRRIKYDRFYLEMELFKKFYSGDKNAFNTLIEYNLGLVVHFAKGYQTHGVNLNDLISEGNIGLINAVNKYDNTRGYYLGTYATQWIKGALKNAITKYGGILKYPSNFELIFWKLDKAKELYEKKFGEEPSLKDIAEYAGLGVEVVNDAENIRRKYVSLDFIESQFEDADLYDEFINKHIQMDDIDLSNFAIDDEMKDESISIYIEDALKTLYDREREVLKMFFGIGCKEHSLDEIGYIYDLTRERVRQVKEKAIRRLRERVGEFLKQQM